MKKFILLFLLMFPCIAKEQHVRTYIKSVDYLLKAWVEDPTEDTYHALHFYMHANKPGMSIADTTQKHFAATLNKVEFNNPQLFKCCLAQEITYGALYCMPQWACAILVGNLMVTSNIIGDCKQLSPENVAQEIKRDLNTIIIDSRKSSIPLSLRMSK